MARNTETRPFEAKNPNIEDLELKWNSLSNSERQVIEFLAYGKDSKTTAMILGLSSKTVESQKFTAYRKLDVNSAAEAGRIYQQMINFKKNKANGELEEDETHL